MMEKKKRPVGIIALSILGIVIGIFSLLLGLIGAGPLSIIFGGGWILFGLRLLKLQRWARKVILAASVVFLAIYLLVFYAAVAVDRFYGIGLVFQFPLAVLSSVSIIYLMLPKVRKVFESRTP
jgi:hypothetical protein